MYVWHVSGPCLQHIIIGICYLNICCKKMVLSIWSMWLTHCGNVGWDSWEVMVVHSSQYTLTHNSFHLFLTLFSLIHRWQGCTFLYCLRCSTCLLLKHFFNIFPSISEQIAAKESHSACLNVYFMWRSSPFKCSHIGLKGTVGYQM
jgi:hypothetical protein